MPVANERVSEEIVREHLKVNGAKGQRVEEQTSSSPGIRRALSSASKSGPGAGKPEFIITFPEENPKLVIVFECKASVSHHESTDRDKPKDYAVDGVLVYAEALSKSFDVIGVAVSGTDAQTLVVSTFRQLKGEATAEPLPSPYGNVDRLVSVSKYQELLSFDPAVRARTEAELLTFSRVLHNYMRDYAKLSEAEKPLIVSGILLALRDTTFQKTWTEHKPRYLAAELFSAIERVARDADINEEKRETMLAPYWFVKTHPELNSPNKEGESPLIRLVSDIDSHVRPFLNMYDNVDVIGQFYGEFLRYTGGDKKGLGIVLTPRHLTELFAQIASIGPNDVIVDTCAGTGGFLISSMAELDKRVGNDDAARLKVRRHQLVAVEQLPHMFALAASNMILRGDGKANLYRGSCFDEDIQKRLIEGDRDRHTRPTVGLINPPFSQKGEGQHELEFVEVLLNVLAPGGTAVVVLPMSCAIEPHDAKVRLLSRHTLVAQMSLPNDMFSPVGTITCAMVFKAHQPHEDSQQDTWFGYWKDDGFVKTKDRGRIDLNGQWSSIREDWLDDFHNRRVKPGSSVAQKIDPRDKKTEWCVEAYMETDYSAITTKSFEETLRDYAVFNLIYGDRIDQSNVTLSNTGTEA